MRINQFLAKYTELSRRAADKAVSDGRVEVNGILAMLGDVVVDSDRVSLDGQEIDSSQVDATIMLHKPTGYVVSRNGQGSKTVYDLLPERYHHLNPVGRLDKDSSGLLLLTTDGKLANELTHPRYDKTKTYEVELNRPLDPLDQDAVHDKGVALEDGPSKLGLDPLGTGHKKWLVTMSEGRNRQIRRTFEHLGYKVTKLHRTNFGDYSLSDLKSGEFSVIV